MKARDFSIRIGNQTAYSASSILEPFQFAFENNFRAFEFFPDRGYSGEGGWAEEDLEKETCTWIRHIGEDNDITFTVHATLEFNPLHEPDHPRLASTVAFASSIGATLVNLHLEAVDDPRRFVEALRPTLSLTAEAGLKLALENTVWTGPRHFEDFFDALRADKEAPSDHVGMCLDLGHANLFDEYRNDFLGYLDALPPDLPVIHLHLHENHGDRDSHLTLFTGPSGDHPEGIIELIRRLRARRFDGCAILEQWPEPPGLLVEARDRLREIIDQRG